VQQVSHERNSLTGVSQLPTHHQHQHETEEKERQSSDAVLDTDYLVIGRENVLLQE